MAIKKCNSLKDKCNAIMINNNNGNKTCRIFETCNVDDIPTNNKGRFYAKKYTESFSIHTIFLIILMIEMTIMIMLGFFAYSKYLRKQLNN